MAAALAGVVVWGHGGIPAEPASTFGVAPDPGRWTTLALEGRPPALASQIAWQAVAPGVERAEVALGESRGWRGRAILARLDPARVRVTLARSTRRHGLEGAWTVDSLSAGALLGLNAGQFDGGRAWGWLVVDGLELQPPGRGPLSMALVVDRAGGARLVPWGQIPRIRFDGQVAWAFQSYPVLLQDGAVPEALLAPGRGVDLEHRDLRLAMGVDADGRLLLALTRYADVAGVSLPFGPNVPEMAALMRALGAEDAVMLDGGLSAQMALRHRSEVHRWRGGRRVPLALEFAPR